MKEYHIETKSVQSGYRPKSGDPRVIPIVQSTTFKFDSSEHVGKLFDFDADGHFYSRLSNPTVDYVEQKIADMEGGVGAMCTSAGQAASMMSIMNICSAGEHVVSSTAIYGGTYNLFAVTMKKLGIEVTFVDPEATEEELQSAIRPNTKAVFGETLANPSLRVLDIEKFAKVAHANGIPLIIDNTFATPVLCRPFEHGADIVVHSTTKYMDGHAVSLGGVIVDSGKFNWDNGKFPCLTTPDESYHGLVYTEKFGNMAYICKARAQLMRDMGAMMSPMNAFLLNLGLETLPLRIRQHSKNALAVAKFLEQHPKIEWINYPGLSSNKDYALAQKYLPEGCSGVISFGVKGGRDGAVKFMDSLELACICVHVADARTCLLHPATTTHRQLSDKQLEESGITPDLVRMSVGIENEEDIIDDIRSALEKC